MVRILCNRGRSRIARIRTGARRTRSLRSLRATGRVRIGRRTASLVASASRRRRWDRPDSNHANGSLRSPFSPSNPCSFTAGARESARASKWDRPDSNRSQTCSLPSVAARDWQGSNRPTSGFARRVRSSQKPMGSPGFEPGSTAPKAASMAKLTHDPASTPTPCRRENVSLRPVGGVQSHTRP